MIEIVFISDDKYALPTGVAINSLRINRNTKIIYNVYLLCNGMSEINKNRFKKLLDRNFNIVLIDIEKEDLFTNLSKSYSNVTSTSLYKFMIPNILTQVNKVIYVDGDVLIQDSLEMLFNENIDSLYAAVVKDGPRKKVLNGGKKHNFSAKSTYFNSGMMLLNLDTLRKENTPQKLINYRLNGYNYFMDQDAFNVIFFEKVKYLSLQYNLLLHILSPIWEMNSIKEISQFYDIPPVKNVEQFFEEGSIIHYTFDKPWKYYDIPQAEKWMLYFKSSPFCDIDLNRTTYLNMYLKSKSFLIGKIITFLPRKIKNAFRKVKGA